MKKILIILALAVAGSQVAFADCQPTSKPDFRIDNQVNHIKVELGLGSGWSKDSRIYVENDAIHANYECNNSYLQRPGRACATNNPNTNWNVYASFEGPFKKDQREKCKIDNEKVYFSSKLLLSFLVHHDDNQKTSFACGFDDEGQLIGTTYDSWGRDYNKLVAKYSKKRTLSCLVNNTEVKSVDYEVDQGTGAGAGSIKVTVNNPYANN